MAERDIPILGPILHRIIGTRNDRFVKKYTQRVNAITALESQTSELTDAQIRGKLAEFRERFDKGANAEDLMVEAFAVAREAMDRAVGIRQIFNSQKGFDPSRLPSPARELYAETKAQMDAREPAMPTGEFLGCAAPVPGWMQVDVPNEIYAAVRELYPESRPPFRARPFDVQLIGGMVLTQGKIAEMKTGEGKTIVGPLACYLACIERLRIHVVTVNDYLVQRDRDWTFPYFHALGLTVGAIHPQHMQDEAEKRRMYHCDVVYGTTAEFGFDYLRDNMKRREEEQVQRRRQFAIVDEVDSILIDEARTPLIISGPAHEDQPRYELADRLARHLVEKNRPFSQADDLVERCKLKIKGYEGDIRQAREKDKIPAIQEQLKAAKAELPALEEARTRHIQYFETKMERKQVHLTHDGVAEAQRAAQIGSFYVDQNIDMPHLLEQSLRAHAVYERDKDYVIMTVPDPMTGRPQPSVVIVDVNTGRPMIGRQWSDGLHQAVECKERVPIKQETQTVATITIQNFFKMYKRLAGMTGTADTEAQEFHDIYKLDVVSIPTNKEVVRRDFDDLVFMTGKDKWSFIVEEIKAFHDVGRPVLVGTTSVEKSEKLSSMLMSKHAIQHEVLNAKQHEREAHIVENAGYLGAVMIATNMAGRGTDIKLGAISRETLLEHWLKRGIIPRTITVDSTDEQLREAAYRRLAPKVLDIQKKEAEEADFADLELRLLRRWAMNHTWLTDREIERMPAEALRESLDTHGRFLLHRIRWFESIEDMGGLHVVGTERHESRRIDNQLRGRSGRQGDKGSSRFFVSFEDDLMKLFAGERVQAILARLGMKEGDAIEHPMVSKNVERAQRKVEQMNFERRKMILEYDEVMEHQRQTFYGLRQRVLEGRDVRGLLFDFIKKTTADAVDEYLDRDFPRQSIAEHAKSVLECSIPPEKFRNKEPDEIEKTIVAEAKYDARQSIDVTLGEYMPMAGSEVAVDFDSQGLVNWAKSRFGVEIHPQELREGGMEERKRVRETLVNAAYQKIETADLSGIRKYLEPNYGASQLAEWADRKFMIKITPDEILAAQKASIENPEKSPVDVILQKAEELYNKREIEYPVDFAMEITAMQMRQNPQEGAQHLVSWANQRYNLGWTMDVFKTHMPAQVRQELKDASERFVAEGRLEKDITVAQALKTDAELEAFLKDKYGVGMPETMRYLQDEERDNAIRSRIESILRAELLLFERTILLDTLDGSWKDHLYAMDQLRDSIGLRAFSQQDPRIEYKREGSHMFVSMLDTVRDRVTDYIFRARLTAGNAGPGAPAPGAPRPPAAPMPAQSPRPAPVGGTGFGSGFITGPGLA
ncbi:MAG: preprotein translocase subunit SecA [Phycisphaerales bacterium]|nr:MAG: preprotein translocase subunit SecA [Phycisphaerales bacterium]